MSVSVEQAHTVERPPVAAEGSPVEDAYPLSMLQGGMLYHMEVMPEAALYHNVNSMHLKAAFDERRLNFIYQEHKADGSQSNFFRLENPGRGD